MTSDNEFLDSLTDEQRKEFLGLQSTIPVKTLAQEEAEEARKRIIAYISKKKQIGWTVRRIRRELSRKYNVEI